MTDSVIWVLEMILFALGERFHLAAKAPILHRSGINLPNSHWRQPYFWLITIVTLNLHIWVHL